MKRPMPLSMQAVLLLSVLFLTSCGGGDDSPTGPESGGDGEGAVGAPTGRLDSRLFGTWIFQESWGVSGVSDSLTFRDDGSGVSWYEGEAETWIWWTGSGQVTVGLRDVFGYAIEDGELTFTAVGEVSSDLGAYPFTADGNPRSLTGGTWVDAHGGELVFSSDGKYDWDDGYEEGVWAAEGRTITIYHELEVYGYEVRGETLTISDDEGGAIWTKE